MIGEVLFGPLRRGALPSDGELRPRVLSIDSLLDVLAAAKNGLPGADVYFFTFKASGNRYVEPDELASLTTEERLGLVLRATRDVPRDPTGTMIGMPVLQVQLGNGTRITAVYGNGQDHGAAAGVLSIIEKQQALFQPRRLQILIPPAALTIAIVAWVVVLVAGRPIPAAAIAGTAALVALAYLVVGAALRLVRELDGCAVPHRILPISYAQIQEQRRNSRKDIRSALIGAAVTAAAGVVLKLLGVDL